MAIIATVCARGGSKGVPRKNVLEIAGKPLVAWTIEMAINCQIIDAVYVSTDDLEITEIAKKYGAKVPYIRSKDLSTDTAPKIL